LRYVSTRGGGEPQRFSDILLEGLAPDGGLYVPEAYPQADLAAWRGKSYPELATAILQLFMDDVPGLQALIARTYTRAASLTRARSGTRAGKSKNSRKA